MQKRKVGKIKNLSYNHDDESLEVTVVITDPKFKKEFLRELTLSGNLSFEGDKLIFIPGEEDASL